jgi:hypothetical protein
MVFQNILPSPGKYDRNPYQGIPEKSANTTLADTVGFPPADRKIALWGPDSISMTFHNRLAAWRSAL